MATTTVGQLSEALFDLSVFIEYALLNESRWMHLNLGCNIAEIVFGACTLVGAFWHVNALAAFGAAALAFVCTAQVALDPRGRSLAFHNLRERFSHVYLQIASMSSVQQASRCGSVRITDLALTKANASAASDDRHG